MLRHCLSSPPSLVERHGSAWIPSFRSRRTPLSSAIPPRLLLPRSQPLCVYEQMPNDFKPPLAQHPTGFCRRKNWCCSKAAAGPLERCRDRVVHINHLSTRSGVRDDTPDDLAPSIIPRACSRMCFLVGTHSCFLTSLPTVRVPTITSITGIRCCCSLCTGMLHRATLAIAAVQHELPRCNDTALTSSPISTKSFFAAE